MMRPTHVLVFLLLLAPVCTNGLSGTSRGGAEALFEPATITTLETVLPETLAQLTSEQRATLLQARSVLVDFFKSLETIDGNPQRIMTDEYTHRNPDREQLRQAIVDSETTVLQVAVTGYTFKSDGVLQLQFYAVSMSEGMFAVGEGRSLFERADSIWKVASVEIGVSEDGPAAPN